MRSRYLVIPPTLLGRFGSNLLFGTSCQFRILSLRLIHAVHAPTSKEPRYRVNNWTHVWTHILKDLTQCQRSAKRSNVKRMSLDPLTEEVWQWDATKKMYHRKCISARPHPGAQYNMDESTIGFLVSGMVLVGECMNVPRERRSSGGVQIGEFPHICTSMQLFSRANTSVLRSKMFCDWTFHVPYAQSCCVSGPVAGVSYRARLTPWWRDHCPCLQRMRPGVKFPALPDLQTTSPKLVSRVVLDSDTSGWLASDSCDNPGDSTLTQLNTSLFLIDSTLSAQTQLRNPKFADLTQLLLNSFESELSQIWLTTHYLLPN